MKLASFLQEIQSIHELDSNDSDTTASFWNETKITGVTSDSRNVKPGMVFVALIGTQTDGHQYLSKALQAGAVAVVIDSKRREQGCLKALKNELKHETITGKTTFFEAENTYQALGELSSVFYGNPGQKMTMVGVTGTNGKTTVTHLLERMLSDHGQAVGMIGTLGQRAQSVISEEPLSPQKRVNYETTGHTTPMAVELHSILAEMESNQTEVVVLEVSSHALEQHRVYGCDFDVAIHTNVTQDHLDYHKTMENYGQAKALLFSGLKSNSSRSKKNPNKNPAAVINLDDAWGERFLKMCPEGTRIYTYGIDSPDATVRPTQKVDYSISGASFTVNTPEGCADVQLKIAGRFSVYNALAAIAGGLALGIPLAVCVQSLATIEGVRGRFEVVSKAPYVIVDYAHTPDGLDNILSAARLVTPEKGRLIAVFGCGGDRDATKRPQMGAIAERLADVLVVTSDNPRTEDPQQILTDVISGIKTFNSDRMLVNEDRKQAIHQAIDLASPNDIIVVAGKGHEDYQILAHQTIHFDDREVVQNYVKNCQQESLA